MAVPSDSSSVVSAKAAKELREGSMARRRTRVRAAMGWSTIVWSPRWVCCGTVCQAVVAVGFSVVSLMGESCCTLGGSACTLGGVVSGLVAVVA